MQFHMSMVFSIHSSGETFCDTFLWRGGGLATFLEKGAGCSVLMSPHHLQTPGLLSSGNGCMELRKAAHPIFRALHKERQSYLPLSGSQIHHVSTVNWLRGFTSQVKFLVDQMTLGGRPDLISGPFGCTLLHCRIHSV